MNRRSVRVSQIVRNLKKLIGSHRLARVTFNPRPEDDFNIWVDEGAWLQMLHNLVVNGLDAAGSQGVVVVSVERRDSCAIFSVGDNGPGIPETDRGHIFEPYFTTKERGAGTGLGLAIAAGVAEKHGGELTLAHSDKSGSTFSASVPLAEPSVEPPVAVPSSHKTERDNAARVLLVEDEPAILRVASRHLTKMGFQVTATSKPQEALDMLGRDCFDVVVSDIVMPGMDGPDLIRRARKKTPNLKVIYVSGYTDDRLKGSGLDPQRDPFLKKPYSLPALAKLIDETAALAT